MEGVGAYGGGKAGGAFDPVAFAKRPQVILRAVCWHFKMNTSYLYDFHLTLQNVVNVVNETVLLAYFSEKSKKYQSSSLWAKYSMVKRTLLVKKNVDISSYHKLTSFLKINTVGHEAKKSMVLSKENVIKFITEAPNETYLMTKLFAIIVFGCISSQGWLYDPKTKREECLYNNDSNACNYGVGIAVIAFLASMGFLAGEYLFEQMSSVKTRKHYVLADLGFSGFWSFLYFVGFWYLASQWGKAADPTGGYGVNNVQAAIAFSFFSIFTWAGCAFFAFQRFRQGSDAAFAPSYEADTSLPTSYPSYPGGPETDQHYQEPPFAAGTNQRAPGDFSAPAY